MDLRYQLDVVPCPRYIAIPVLLEKKGRRSRLAVVIGLHEHTSSRWPLSFHIEEYRRRKRLRSLLIERMATALAT